MERFTVREHGFAGKWYPGEKGTDKIIIFVGGAMCTEKIAENASKFIRDAGYSMLLLGFYSWKDTPKSVCQIPVEYTERAVKYLQERFHPKKIIMTGASTGAGYSLLSASLIPEISGVAAIVPYDYVMESTTIFKRRGVSVYTWRGKDLPYTPYKIVERGIFKLLRDVKKDKDYGVDRLIRYGYDDCEQNLNPESRIRTENIQGDLLLIACKDDDCWPSDVAVPRIQKNLEEHGFSHRVIAKVYEKGSHAIGGDYVSAAFYMKPAVKKLMRAEKKWPKECDEAREQCKKDMLDFFESV